MLCQHCQKRIANVHFTQIVNNSKIEMYLCEQCAREKGKIGFGAPLSMSDFLLGLMGFDQPSAYMASLPGGLVCDKCGMSYDDFQKIGKLGCSNCYTVYGDRLKPLIKRLHGNVEHHGKVPGKVSEGIKVSREIEKLREALNKAIQKEEYEKAAEIRDKIRILEAKKGS